MAENSAKDLSGEIDAHKAEIIQLWIMRLRERSTPTASVAAPILLDSLPAWLDRLTQYLKQPDSPFKLEKLASRAKEHGRQRANVNFNLDRVLFEYVILQQIIFEVFERNRPLSPVGRDLILDAIQLSMRNAAVEHNRTTSARRRIEALGTSTLPPAKRYLLTLAIVLLATLTQKVLWPAVNPFAYTLYYPAVTLASLYGSGVFAILLSALVSQYLFVPPLMSFRFENWQEAIRLLIFMGSAYLISVITSALRAERVLSEVAVTKQENARRMADESAESARIAHAESERRAAVLRAVIESIPDGVYIGDAKGLSSANMPGLKMLGFNSADELTKSIPDLVQILKTSDPETGGALTPDELPFLKALKGQSNSRDVMIRKVNTGEEICIRSAAAPIRQEGKILGAVAVNTDITDKKKSEARLRENVAALELEKDLREQFVSTLSHDLRSPLGAARISAELLLKKWDQLPSRTRILSGLFNNLSRVDKMIRDLLDANRVRAGQALPIEFEPCDIRSVAETTLEALALIHGDRFRLHSEDRIQGFCSPDGIRRILENLCNNAVKYGSEVASIDVTFVSKGNRVLISVHNFGNPIPPEEQSRLFVHFRRTDTAEKSVKKGWGLGLALVKGIAEAHGGHVSVQSTPDEGTTFLVEIPRDPRGIQNQAA